MIRKLPSNLSKQSLSILQQQIRLFSKLWKQEAISSNLQKQETIFSDLWKHENYSFNLWQFKYNVGGCVNAFGGDRWYLDGTWQQRTIQVV